MQLLLQNIMALMINPYHNDTHFLSELITNGLNPGSGKCIQVKGSALYYQSLPFHDEDKSLEEISS